MDQYLFLLVFLFLFTSCSSQTPKANTSKDIGGPCEGCEAIFEYDELPLASIDTLPGYQENEPKLKIRGTVFQKNGKTPAPNVPLYIYQANRKGIYEKKGTETGWGKRHGFIRAWIKTDENGKYTFYTFRPAAYPGRQEPEHIHITLKEPNKKEYYIDEFVFDDDPLLTKEKRQALENRGGSGIVFPGMENGILSAKRDIVLGLNISGYE